VQFKTYTVILLLFSPAHTQMPDEPDFWQGTLKIS